MLIHTYLVCELSAFLHRYVWHQALLNFSPPRRYITKFVDELKQTRRWDKLTQNATNGVDSHLLIIDVKSIVEFSCHISKLDLSKLYENIPLTQYSSKYVRSWFNQDLLKVELQKSRESHCFKIFEFEIKEFSSKKAIKKWFKNPRRYENGNWFLQGVSKMTSTWY